MEKYVGFGAKMLLPFAREVLKAKDGLREGPIKAVFLDLDDLLFPSTKFTAFAREKALRAMIRYGLSIDYGQLNDMLDNIIERRTSNYSRHFNILLAQLKVPMHVRPLYIAAAVRAYHDTKNTIAPYDDVPAVLGELSSDYPLYIASDGLAVKQYEKLLRLDLVRYFTDVFISEELKCSKEDKRFYEKLAAAAGIKGYEGVMVGDREKSDVIPARAAGFHTARVIRGDGKYGNDTNSSADEIIRDLYALPDALKRIEQRCKTAQTRQR